MGLRSALSRSIVLTRGAFAGRFLAAWMAGGVFFPIFTGIYSVSEVVNFTIFAFLMTIPFGLPLLLLGVALSGHRPRPQTGYFTLYLFVFAIGAVGPWYSPFWNEPEPEEDPQVEHDRLADKNPAFLDTPEHWKTIPYGSGTPNTTHTLEINKSAAVISLDLTKIEDIDHLISAERFATYHDTVAFLEARDLPWVPSVQMVDQKVKAFSDAAYAAIDLFTQREADRLGGGRQVFLEGLLQKCLADDAKEAAAFVADALQLSGAEPTLPPEVAELANTMRMNFLADPYASKPIGFYTESEALQRVFRQNRFCQQNLPDLFAPPMADAIASDIARLLNDSTDLALAYDAILALQSRTTNPPGDGFTGLKDYTQKTPEQYSHIALFPPSGSKENALYRDIYGTPELPNENIMNRLIRAIQDGNVDLTPDENSGWYDYQVHALETLLVPERGQEGDKLLLSKAYKERLLEAFRTILTKQRELHVGHLYAEQSAESAPIPLEPTIVTPDISLEPTATYYLRSARALRFLENAVTAILGESDYATITLANGAPLTKALPEVAQLLYGLYFKVCDDIGMPLELLPDELTADQIAQARANANTWLEAPGQDKTFAADVRYIVPVMADAGHTEVRYWMTTGIRIEKVKAEYVREPQFRLNGEVLEDRYTQEYNGITLAPREFYLPVEEFAEATGPSTPYTREEFHALCDAAGNREAIIHAVENGGPSNPVSRRFVLFIVAILIAGVLTSSFAKGRKRRRVTSEAIDS